MAFGSGRIWILLLLSVFPVNSEFRFENCGIQDNLIELSSFEAWPDPVVVRENLTISFLGRILRDIPESSQLEVRYYGIRQIFGLHLDVLLPCLLGKYGSCTLPLCNYMHRYQEQVCPLLSGRNGTECACPPKPGNYTADSVEIQMAKTSAITRFFLKIAGSDIFCTPEAKYFRYEDCGRKDDIVEVSKFQISPDPVNMNKNMTIDAAFKFLSDIPEGAVVKTQFYKIKSLFGVNIDVPIPCLLGRFGSCTLPLCEYLELYKDQAEVFFPPDKEYGCPVTAGDYGSDNAEVKIPDMGLVAKIIVSGKYRTEIKILDRRGGKQLVCYKIWTELK